MSPRLAGIALIAALFWAVSPVSADDFTLPDASKLRLPPKAVVRRVDLIGQFIDASTRKQCDVGSCHAFGSMAILEAAYKRQYKKPIRFSEAYVFLKRTVANGGVYRQFCASGDCRFSEFNDVLGDVRYAIDKGVPSSLDYDAFLKRYRPFREKQEAAMKAAAPLLPDEKSRRMWAGEQKAAYDELDKALLSDPEISQEAADNFSRIRRFAVREFPFDQKEADYSHLLSPEDCRKRGLTSLSALTGLTRLNALSEELDAGRPAAVGANLTELKKWRQKPGDPPAGHVFAVVGYTYSVADGYAFQTRNSWGGDNPDLLENELCRVDSIISVLNEDEARR